MNPLGPMSDDPLIVARLLFWIFAIGVLVLPLRWSLFCFILASHMDITWLTFASATAVGFENTVRIIVLPALLLVRTGFVPLKQFQWTLPAKLWLLLVAYAAVAGTWGGFPLSAAKMVAYLAAYIVLYLTFSCAWSAGWFDMSMIRLTAWCAVALAILQTFVLGDDWGGIEQRFTSFTSPQYFAACLVSLLAILVFSGTRGWFHYATCTLIVAAILLSGSRYVFISTILLLIIAAFRVSGDSHSLRFHISTKKMVITLGVAAAVAAALISYLPQNRLDEMFSAASEGDVKVEDVGTLSWRLGIYQEIFERLDRRSFTQLFFGSGTSSGAILMLDRDSYNYEPDAIDANRVLHSEFLRALYEWGIVGMALLLAFLVCTIIAFARKIAADGGGTALAFLGVLPSVVMGLAIENVLAGAASAAGVGILLAMSFAWRAEPEYSVESYQLEGFNSEGRALSA